jgi:hypothetical protein
MSNLTLYYQVLTALLDNTFTAEDLGVEEVDRIRQVVQESLTDGVTGASTFRGSFQAICMYS